MSTKVEDVVHAYVGKRDKLRAMKAEHDAQQAAIKADLEVMEAWLGREVQRIGVQALKTPYGTAYTTVTATASVEDWEQTLAFIQENEEYSLLAHAVNKTVVKDIIERYGSVPPGVRYAETRGISVRKS